MNKIKWTGKNITRLKGLAKELTVVDASKCFRYFGMVETIARKGGSVRKPPKGKPYLGTRNYKYSWKIHIEVTFDVAFSLWKSYGFGTFNRTHWIIQGQQLKAFLESIEGHITEENLSLIVRLLLEHCRLKKASRGRSPETVIKLMRIEVRLLRLVEKELILAERRRDMAVAKVESLIKRGYGELWSDVIPYL